MHQFVSRWLIRTHMFFFGLDASLAILDDSARITQPTRSNQQDVPFPRPLLQMIENRRSPILLNHRVIRSAGAYT
jgi:hypothetical protein